MTDKVALITGASSGIGRATAQAFAASGARVVVAARRQDELDSLVAEEDWDRVLNINLRGIFLCLKYEASYITGTTLTPDGGFTLTI